jgi:hypothetical protein
VSITLFESWDEIAALVVQFESGELPAARWTHREHLTVAFWYVSRLPQEAAMERMRAGIIHTQHGHARLSRNDHAILDGSGGRVVRGA